MSDLPYRDKIRHDDCSEIIEAWRSGRLIDREAIDYETAYSRLSRIVGYLEQGYVHPPMHMIEQWSHETVDAALGLDKETTT